MKVPDGSAACICRRLRRHGLDPWVRKSSWKWQPTPLFLPGKSHGWEEHGRLQSMRFQRVDHDWARTAYEIMCNNIMNGIFSIIVFNWLSLTFINMYVYIYIVKKEMATHSSILAWKIPWTEEPGWLQSMGSQRVGHNWVTNTHTHILYLAILLGSFILVSFSIDFFFFFFFRFYR